MALTNTQRMDLSNARGFINVADSYTPGSTASLYYIAKAQVYATLANAPQNTPEVKPTGPTPRATQPAPTPPGPIRKPRPRKVAEAADSDALDERASS